MVADVRGHMKIARMLCQAGVDAAVQNQSPWPHSTHLCRRAAPQATLQSVEARKMTKTNRGLEDLKTFLQPQLPAVLWVIYPMIRGCLLLNPRSWGLQAWLDRRDSLESLVTGLCLLLQL